MSFAILLWAVLLKHMNTISNLPGRLSKLFKRLRHFLRAHQLGSGALALAAILALLSALASFNFSPKIQLFLAGEVAAGDIIAPQGLVLEDKVSTRSRQEKIRAQQPLVCDINPDATSQLRDRVSATLAAIHNAKDRDALESVRTALMDETGREIPLGSFLPLAEAETQAFIMNHVLPWAEERLHRGIAPDLRLLLSYKGGILVRNPENGSEALYPVPQDIMDLNAFESELFLMIRALSQGTPSGKRAANTLIAALIMPSLSPNYEATKAKAEEAVRAIAPIVHQIQKGEVVARQGERITREQQLKIQALIQKKDDRFNHTAFIGTFLTSLILASGLFFSPGGKKASPVLQKDLVFIGSLVALFATMAKGLVLVGQKIVITNPSFSPDALAYLVPVAGAAGLASLAFSRRRYVCTGLLLAFFCSLMYKASLSLFLFYFFGTMWNTWLIVHTENRQDVVKSTLSLILGLSVMWLAATLMQGGPHNRYLQEFVALAAGGVLSMLLVFALAPLIEVVFGYSTRFRLMELMNLDQPIMRELMLKAPGTYHHSLIVAHMVESAAKAIGANSLLCKVAALYHDIGKITRPDYFIENQAGRENPHDRLAPSMSALILTSHVKKGVELAQTHRLGSEVIDIIRQHHGTGTIAFFFNKAKSLGEDPKVADYSYPGPKPQTREAALVLLADVVEASSRTLDDPTPSRLQTHIDTMLKNIFATGQMDEADLTLRDIDQLGQSFLRVLAGLFHHRIKYPDKNLKPGEIPASEQAHIAAKLGREKPLRDAPAEGAVQPGKETKETKEPSPKLEEAPPRPDKPEPPRAGPLQ